MSLQIPVQKDIGEYEEKIVGKMSLRTLACVAGGFASAVLAACVVYFGFGVEVGNATLPVMAASLPFWLAGFWRPCGMKLEEFVPLFARHSLCEEPLLYEPWAQAAPLPDTYPKPGKPSAKARRAAKRKGAENHEPSIQNAQTQR